MFTGDCSNSTRARGVINNSQSGKVNEQREALPTNRQDRDTQQGYVINDSTSRKIHERKAEHRNDSDSDSDWELIDKNPTQNGTPAPVMTASQPDPEDSWCYVDSNGNVTSDAENLTNDLSGSDDDQRQESREEQHPWNNSPDNINSHPKNSITSPAIPGDTKATPSENSSMPETEPRPVKERGFCEALPDGSGSICSETESPVTNSMKGSLSDSLADNEFSIIKEDAPQTDHDLQTREWYKYPQSEIQEPDARKEQANQQENQPCTTEGSSTVVEDHVTDHDKPALYLKPVSEDTQITHKISDQDKSGNAKQQLSNFAAEPGNHREEATHIRLPISKPDDQIRFMHTDQNGLISSIYICPYMTDLLSIRERCGEMNLNEYFLRCREKPAAKPPEKQRSSYLSLTTIGTQSLEKNAPGTFSRENIPPTDQTERNRLTRCARELFELLDSRHKTRSQIIPLVENAKDSLSGSLADNEFSIKGASQTGHGLQTRDLHQYYPQSEIQEPDALKEKANLQENQPSTAERSSRVVTDHDKPALCLEPDSEETQTTHKISDQHKSDKAKQLSNFAGACSDQNAKAIVTHLPIYKSRNLSPDTFTHQDGVVFVPDQTLVGDFTKTPLKPITTNKNFSENAFFPPKDEQSPIFYTVYGKTDGLLEVEEKVTPEHIQTPESMIQGCSAPNAPEMSIHEITTTLTALPFNTLDYAARQQPDEDMQKLNNKTFYDYDLLGHVRKTINDDADKSRQPGTQSQEAQISKGENSGEKTSHSDGNTNEITLNSSQLLPSVFRHDNPAMLALLFPFCTYASDEHLKQLCDHYKIHHDMSKDGPLCPWSFLTKLSEQRITFDKLLTDINNHCTPNTFPDFKKMLIDRPEQHTNTKYKLSIPELVQDYCSGGLNINGTELNKNRFFDNIKHYINEEPWRMELVKHFFISIPEERETITDFKNLKTVMEDLSIEHIVSICKQHQPLFNSFLNYLSPVNLPDKIRDTSFCEIDAKKSTELQQIINQQIPSTFKTSSINAHFYFQAGNHTSYMTNVAIPMGLTIGSYFDALDSYIPADQTKSRDEEEEIYSIKCCVMDLYAKIKREESEREQLQKQGSTPCCTII